MQNIYWCVKCEEWVQDYLLHQAQLEDTKKIITTMQQTVTYRTLQSGEESCQKPLNPHLTTVTYHLYYSFLFYFIFLSEHHSVSPQLLSSSSKCLKGFSIHRGSQEQLRVTGSQWPWPEQSSEHTAQIWHSKWQWVKKIYLCVDMTWSGWKKKKRVIQEEMCCSVPLTDCVHSEDFEEQIICFLLQELIPQETGQFWTRNRPIRTLH